MSISNTFNWSRFLRLCKQNMIHNTRLMIFASIGFCGVVFIVLTIGRLGNNLEPFTPTAFLQIMVTLVAIFSILYAGYSFPSFRNKESSINYLTVPASAFEKVLFEFVNRIVLSLIVLPLLFWLTFNIQGPVFSLVTPYGFSTVGLGDILAIDLSPVDELFWAQALIVSCTFLVLVLPFTGAALFSKQPLIKTLFTIAVIIMFYSAVVYVVAEPLGLNKYNASSVDLILVPNDENSALRFFAIAASLSAALMLFVAYRKVKEKEV